MYHEIAILCPEFTVKDEVIFKFSQCVNMFALCQNYVGNFIDFFLAINRVLGNFADAMGSPAKLCLPGKKKFLQLTEM